MAPKAKAKPMPPDKGRGANLSTPPAAAAEGPSVDDLIAVLEQHVKAKDYKQALKVSEQILAIAPRDAEASRCKVVALVQLGNVADALAAIEGSRDLAADLYFEKAYCLYRQNKLQEALASLKSGEQSAAVVQLEAQIYHRMGDLGVCISTYERLMQKYKVDADEVKTNIIAAYVSGGRSTEVPALMDTLKVSPKTSFDLAYNAACGMIERGEFQKAEELLLLARRVGQEMLIEDEYTEQEIDDELAPIAVQLCYVQQVQGRVTEAISGYSALLKKKPADAPSVAVASNNLIALRGAKELFDSLKKFDKITEKKGGAQQLQFVEGLEHKLSGRQKEAMSFNRFLLLLYSNKLDQARELVPLLVQAYPNSVMPTILAASLYLKEGKPGKAEEILAQYGDAHVNGASAVLLVRAHAAAAGGQFLRAAECLEKIEELKTKPGMIATVVALRERGGDVKGAEGVLDGALQWWQDNRSSSDTSFEAVVLEAAAFKVKHNKQRAAAKLYQELSKSSSPSVRSEALHGLICCTADLDPDTAESYAAELPALPGLASLNVAAVVQTGPAMAKRARGGEDGLAKEGEEKRKAKRRRKRKPLYPKGFDPANPGPPPDPERWLPRRERSSFKPKKKDKRAQQIRGSQGAVSKDRAPDPTPASTVAESSKPAASGPRGKKKGRR